MRVSVAQINPLIGDLKGNTKKILHAIERARADQADLILFSELSICGYPPQDLLLHNDFIEEMERCLEKIVEASEGICVVVGLARKNVGKGKDYFNSAAVIENGKLLGFYDKCLLPTYDVFDEHRYFEPGEKVKVWNIQGYRIAVLICEDIWQHSGNVDTRYRYDPVKELIAEQPTLVLNLSASPYQFDKPDVRLQVCVNAIKTLNCPVVMSCQVGGNDDLVFDGYSMYVDAEGRLLQLGKGFEEDLFTVDLKSSVCPLAYTYDHRKDLYRALVLGLKDYFSKQGFKKACLGISGGIDSALVACIAADALGPENVLGIAMPSRYSSKSSVEDAEMLAKNLGIGYRKISIEAPFDDYLKLLHPFFEGRAPDVTEENLQARIRGMILMALSNKLGHIVLSTGNKSEMAVGYCTLYGDMAGGLGVISDVFKTQVYDLSRWINREKEIIPWSTIEKEPSAELRHGQKDTDSLPPYDVLDRVLKAYVEEHLSPREIAKDLKVDPHLVEKIVLMIYRAEYKRRQAPPGIRVSKKAFSVGRRFPIVQGWVERR